MDYEGMWRLITIKGETHPFESGNAKSTSICNLILQYLHRAITQLIFAEMDSGGVSNTELYMLLCLLNRRGLNLGQMIATYFDLIIKREDEVICCGGIITKIVEHLGISTEDLHPDMGESFLTYEALFAMECLKVDSNGQGFFIQNEGNHFPVPNPLLTKIDGWNDQTNWKLNGPIHRRVIHSTPMIGMFRKNKAPRTTPIYDPTTHTDYGSMQTLSQPEAGPSNMHSDAQEP